MSRCECCEGEEEVIARDLGLAPLGLTPVEVPAAELRHCLNPDCDRLLPTRATLTRCLQALGISEDAPLPGTVRVFVRR